MEVVFYSWDTYALDLQAIHSAHFQTHMDVLCLQKNNNFSASDVRVVSRAVFVASSFTYKLSDGLMFIL